MRMMKKLLLVLSLLLTYYSYGQIRFEPGYIINNEGEKINCLIRNVDWRYSPERITYKGSATAPAELASIENIKEFEIKNEVKYQRFTLVVDTSSENLAKLSINAEPEWKEKTVFLKVLQEGRLNLYELNTPEKTSFFIKKEDSIPLQLIYKRYTKDQTGDVFTNTHFKVQLWNMVKDGEIVQTEVENISYSKTPLEKIVRKYNGATAQATTDAKPSRPFFHLAIKPRLNFSSLDLRATYTDNRVHRFNTKTSFSAGIEGEFDLPFNKGKWSIPVEVGFQTFKGAAPSGSYTAHVDYTTLEIPLGLRYYAVLTDEMKIYLNAFLVLNKAKKTEITFDNSQQILPLSPTTNLAGGLGLEAFHLSLELRMYSNRQILNDVGKWDAPYKNLSLILGYKIF